MVLLLPCPWARSQAGGEKPLTTDTPNMSTLPELPGRLAEGPRAVGLRLHVCERGRCGAGREEGLRVPRPARDDGTVPPRVPRPRGSRPSARQVRTSSGPDRHHPPPVASFARGPPGNVPHDGDRELIFPPGWKPPGALCRGDGPRRRQRVEGIAPCWLVARGPRRPGGPPLPSAVQLLELEALVAVAVTLGVAEVVAGGGAAALLGRLLGGRLAPVRRRARSLAEVLALHAELLAAAGQDVLAGGPGALGPRGARRGPRHVSALARSLRGKNRGNGGSRYSGTARGSLSRQRGFCKALYGAQSIPLAQGTRAPGAVREQELSADASSRSHESRPGPREAEWSPQASPGGLRTLARLTSACVNNKLPLFKLPAIYEQDRHASAKAGFS